MLTMTEAHRLAIVAHALDGLPLEACGLIVGRRLDAESVDAVVTRFVPTENEAQSAKVYTVPAIALLRTERDAEDDGQEILGVVHSHTHTEGYPSPTDIRQAPDPQWHYVIISLRDGGTAMRSYKIVDGAVIEEPILVNGE